MCVDKEFSKQWLGRPEEFTPTVPFRVITGCIVSKKEATEGHRLVWNASWPLPDSYAGVVRNSACQWSEVAANNLVELPQGRISNGPL